MQPHNIFFRAGVGIIITNHQGQVAIFERTDEPGAWQFPQGGMYQGESPGETMFRELGEETGLNRDQVSGIKEIPFLGSYVYPRALLDSFASTGANYIGQTLCWFTMNINDGVDIDLSLAADPELSDVRWVSPDEALDLIVDFKRPMYEQIMEHLS